jgi:hypothetical protein
VPSSAKLSDKRGEVPPSWTDFSLHLDRLAAFVTTEIHDLDELWFRWLGHRPA